MKGKKLILFCILYAVLCLPLVSCRPRGILHSWEMREVLVDLHKTDAMLQLSGLQYGHDEAANIYYAMTLERHGVTQAQFDSSLVWYTAHPLLFNKIYPKVLKELAREKEDFSTEHAEELLLGPMTKEEMEHARATKPTHAFTKTQLDSVLWVAQHGYPTLWIPLPKRLMHDSENQLLP